MFKYVTHGTILKRSKMIPIDVLTTIEYVPKSNVVIMFQNRMLNRITHPMAPHKSPVPYEIEAVPPVVLQYLRDGGTPLYVYCTQRRYF